MKIAATAIALGLASTQLFAQYAPPPPPPGYPATSFAPAPRPVSLLLGVGLTGGGDKLATATYTDGSTSSINAGGLIYMKIGLDWRINPDFSAQGSFGYHRDSVSARNGELKFERTFVEGLGFWHFQPRHRIGLGLRQTSGAQMTSSGAASSAGNVDFKSSMGTVLEYEWMISRSSSWGYGLTVCAVNEKYTPTSLNGAPATGPDVNGSHLGVGVNFYF